MLTYLHAKWIAYHYDIPLLYKFFPYSDQLILSDIEQCYKDSELQKRFLNVKVLSPNDPLCIDRNSSTLYVVPYFPDCLQEIEQPTTSCYYFPVAWDDEGFKNELHKYVRPKYQLPMLKKVDNAIIVAVHVRKGGCGVDWPLSQDFPEGLNTPGYHFLGYHYPLLVPPDSYYIEAIRYLACFFNDQQVCFCILSDAQYVDKMTDRYRKAVDLPNATFVCRTSGNNHDHNVLEDFFFITQCDCLIRSESTYAFAASRLGDYLIQISPAHHHWYNGHLAIDESKIIARKNIINKRSIWVWPHSGPWCRCTALREKS